MVDSASSSEWQIAQEWLQRCDEQESDDYPAEDYDREKDLT